MGDNIVDKAKEKLADADDVDRETQRRAAAAAGGTPDVPVETEEDLEREAETDPTRRSP
jgi:hypothetical protein